MNISHLPRALMWWYGLTALGGLAFGLIGDRRPLGTDLFAHPLVIFFIIVGIGLLLLRMVLARPVPAVLPERALIAGCFVGLGFFLIGNFVATHMIGALR
jgi:hypothetical protein